jgi:TonB family protein
MPRSFLSALLSLLAFTFLNAQSPRARDVTPIGPGVTPPRLLHKVEPEYSPEANADRVQGTVILQIIVDEKGRPTEITLISPLGFGLDEKAQAAVAKWEFAPGLKGGKPVKILAVIEVNFRFSGVRFDEKAESQRTKFNLAVQNVNRDDGTPDSIDRAVKSIQELSAQKYSPAMYLLGKWEAEGDHVTKDAADGLALLQKAAAKNYGPALYEIAVRRIEGKELPKDIDKALAEMRNAATLGSRQAQFDLGVRYEKGNGVPRELDRARRYFRLCATHGVALCQYRLGSLLFDAPDRPERDYIQAIALFQLAGEQKVQDARDIVSREAANLTPEQAKWVTTLKAQLVRK